PARHRRKDKGVLDREPGFRGFFGMGEKRRLRGTGARRGRPGAGDRGTRVEMVVEFDFIYRKIRGRFEYFQDTEGVSDAPVASQVFFFRISRKYRLSIREIGFSGLRRT